MQNRSHTELEYQGTGNIELNETQRALHSQGIWEVLESDEYETIENSFETITVLTVASGKYGLLCPEQEELSGIYTKLPTGERVWLLCCYCTRHH